MEGTGGESNTASTGYFFKISLVVPIILCRFRSINLYQLRATCPLGLPSRLELSILHKLIRGKAEYEVPVIGEGCEIIKPPEQDPYVEMEEGTYLLYYNSKQKFPLISKCW